MNDESLAAAILGGDRRACARAITLIESTRPDHRLVAEALLSRLMPHTGKAVRVGFTGIPGVGKSTLIEAFGLNLIAQGHRPAVLAVDPSSPVSGGSILGDKTRMEFLSRDPRAFIRPSPSSGTLGGVARRTREAMLICEAAGHDVIIVETVGVGQSEVAVAGLVDVFVLLVAPGAGDELQGIKKGIVELADMIVVTKADGDLALAAERAARDYGNALHLLGRSGIEGGEEVDVLRCSAASGLGIGDIWSAITRRRERAIADGSYDNRRASQAKAWMWDEINETLISEFKGNAQVCASLKHLESLVERAETPPGLAARTLVDLFKRLPT